MSSPTGGAKDTTAPEIVAAIPADHSVNFSSVEIVFTFNEYVKLNNISQQLVISPALEELPEFRIKKRSVIMTLKNALEPNTTYTFNFGDAIVDVNENNPLKGFTYVVSTGDFIDSLKVSGKVLNSFSAVAQKEFVAMLYDTSATDSTPYLKKPLYLAKTDANGEFIIRNVREGNYKLLAIGDINKDYKFQVVEDIAFADSLIPAGTDSAQVLLRSFKELPDKISLGSKKFDDQKRLIIGLNGPCNSCNLAEPDGQQVIYSQWKDSDKDTLFAQLRNVAGMDSIVFFLRTDSTVTDTLQFYPSKSKKRSDARQKFNLVKTPMAEANEYLSLSFAEPITNLESAAPVTVMKSDSTFFTSRLIADTVNQGLYYLDFPATPEERYRIFLADSSFFGLYGGVSGGDTLMIEVQKAEFYGNLIFTIDNQLNSPAVLLFTDTKTGAVKSRALQAGKNRVEFKQLPPSGYGLAVVVDQNGNGKWDTGKYLLRRQPETVINYTEPIQIRSNWDLELEWVVHNGDIK